MSANRSVLAAQRRRAGPTNSEPGIPGRGPQPSINSSQMFANQGKQQQQQQQQPTKAEGLSSINKMTVPQAITLITLRLGSLESKLMNMQESGLSNIQMEGQENMILIDQGVIQSITSRLESLEKRSSTSSGSASGSASGPEVNLLKQQFEIVKQSVIQNKSVSATLVKDNRDLKNLVENLNRELTETKELLQALQNLTMDNSQKLMNISMDNGEMLESVEEMDYDNLVSSSDFTNVEEINDKAEIVTGNLKTMIENEINASI